MYRGILHTSFTDYKLQYQHIDFQNVQNKENLSLKNQVSTLEYRESQYYSLVGASNIFDFIKKVREILKPEIINDLAQFSNQNLSKSLKDFAQMMGQTPSGTDLEKTAVTIVIDTSELKEIPASSFLKTNAKMTAKGKITIDVSLKNTTEIKTILNELNEYQNKDKKNRKLKTEAESLVEALRRITNFENSGILTTEQGNKKFSTLVRGSQNYLGFPWSFIKKDLEQALKNENTKLILNEQLVKANQQIYDFLLSLCSQSDTKQAIKEEWYRVTGGSRNVVTLETNFFMKGGYIQTVIGALGEFQMALFQNILQKKLGITTLKASISGNIFTGSEQAKADVVLGGILGIQVKNYDLNRNRNIEGNIHPNKLAKDYNMDLEDNFFEFLANYHFNSDLGGSLTPVIDDLENALASILNFDSFDNIFNDSIAFYLISGGYLVPASHILRHYLTINQDSEKKGSAKIEITGPTPKSSSELQKISSKYFIYSDGAYTPTSENKTEYINYLSHKISIRGTFNYSPFITDSYRLF